MVRHVQYDIAFHLNILTSIIHLFIYSGMTELIDEQIITGAY